MKYLLLALLLLIPSVSQAREGTGIGVVLGIPTGVNARHWMSNLNAIDVNAGWSLANTSRFIVNANYLWNKPDALEVGDEHLDVFFGAGLGIRTKSGKADGELVFGPRLPVGISYFFTDPVVEVFGQAGLNLGLLPSADFYLDAGVGVRFYF